MGNNNSCHQQSYASNGLSQSMGRGWTQSFPRELGRHQSQPGGHKVLPEPPNQRLRATNNGSIIHNGGTISGRRPSALTLPHDLNKQGIFRSRSTSASNLGAGSRTRKGQQHHCCTYQSEENYLDNEMQELKRFGSEPDLRYSPTATTANRQYGLERRHCSGYYPERDSRERESRYKGKKKYKAPAPPGANGGTIQEDSSADSYKWDIAQDARCRNEEEVQPPPRRSRLFKTRAESKRAQVNWLSASSSISQSHQERVDGVGENERRWRHDRSATEMLDKRTSWREEERHQQKQQQQQQQQRRQDRWCRDDESRRSKIFHGKNTLQRSMSSPEFQAELMQVARKVRNKLNCNRKSADASSSASLDRKSDAVGGEVLDGEERKKVEKRSARHQVVSSEECALRGNVISRVHEKRKLLTERCITMEKKKTSCYEDRRSDCSRETTRSKDHAEEREEKAAIGNHRKRTIEKLGIFDEETTNETRSGQKERPNTFERSSCMEEKLLDRRRSSEHLWKSRKYEDTVDSARRKCESPIRFSSKERHDVRGQGSGRESTPEPQEQQRQQQQQEEKRRDKENCEGKKNSKGAEKRWSESEAFAEKKDNAKEKVFRKFEAKEKSEANWHILPRTEKSTPKTFYFGMDEPLSKERRNVEEEETPEMQSRLQCRESNESPVYTRDEGEDVKNTAEDISLKLRPTLPKKQLEIPRFSPSAAWRLLSALEAPGPTMSTASEEVPVMFEERIERLSRPPPPLIALEPRSSHDKSGDSGISGDAGAANDDSLDVGTMNRMKTAASRPTWTPQQDLGEESSSDAGVDSPPPMPTSLKYTSKPHVFSLSLPRDENRMYLYNVEPKAKDSSAFNSLQKLKRSVSGAFGLCPMDLEKKQSNEVLDDNWLLSSSAPNSLQHNQIADISRSSPPSAWKTNFEEDDLEDEEEEEEDRDDSEERNDFPVIMKPPSFSYLASGGHVMYLPEANGPSAGYQSQSFNYKSGDLAKNRNSTNSASRYGKNRVEECKRTSYKVSSPGKKEQKKASKENRSSFAEGKSTLELDRPYNSRNRFSNFSKSCENICEMRQRNGSPGREQQNLQDSKETACEMSKAAKNSNAKGKRFTFQSTVRQIERRRLAEKLSREAEAKERQRRGELEAMRKVEEEFQRKRAREKANIRQQLRLYSMDENMSLPVSWDASQLSRADPDGAPSSSASSPTSAPLAKMTTNKKSSVSNEEHQRKEKLESRRGAGAETRQQQQQQQREYKDYRPKYYNWTPENSSHLEYKQTTVHPKVVCDIPKNSAVFVDANAQHGKTANANSTPRSDNYRKDFAHGAVAARSSLASSDSELSQPNTRPHSRQTGNKSKPLRSRSASPERSEEAASSEDESPVEPIKQERNPINGFILNGVQPFVREKSYRPISFNPQPPPPIPS